MTYLMKYWRYFRSLKKNGGSMKQIRGKLVSLYLHKISNKYKNEKVCWIIYVQFLVSRSFLFFELLLVVSNFSSLPSFLLLLHL